MFDAHHFVFDCESIGFYGEAFAWGAVLVGPDGKEEGSWSAACDPVKARGGQDGRAWVEMNVRVPAWDCQTPREMRNRFWKALQEARERAGGPVLNWYHVGYPVETEFLRRVYRDQSEVRKRLMPKPVNDVETMVLLTGLAEPARLPAELPEHNPLSEARYAARILGECLKRLAAGPATTGVLR